MCACVHVFCCKDKTALDLLCVQRSAELDCVLRIALLQCYVTVLTRRVCVCVIKPMRFKCPSEAHRQEKNRLTILEVSFHPLMITTHNLSLYIALSNIAA